MHGTVSRIERGAGDRVDPDSAVATVEADRMRVAVQAGVAGVVDEVRVAVGAAVEPGQPLVAVAAYAETAEAAGDAGAEGDVVHDVEDEVVADQDVGGSAPPDSVACTRCGCEHMEAGFFDDRGAGPGSYLRWIEGRLQIGFFGAWRFGRRHRAVEAYRCPLCSHLELFATEEV